MRSILTILLTLFALVVLGQDDYSGTKVAAKITAGSSNATYSIGDTREMKGTPKSVATTALRDAIPAARREQGMECWVIDIAKMYRLVGGILNANWVEVTASSGTSAQSGRVNVVDYGATPYLHNDNSVPVSLALPDQHTFITNAIAAAAASTGHSNVVYFPPGIYPIDRTIWVPKNVFIEGVGVMMANGASPYATTTNNYSMIWRRGQGEAVAFYQVGPGNGNGIRNISIHGYTNPVDSVSLVTAPSAALGTIALRAFNEDTFWCQRFDMENVSFVGFRIGFWGEVNGSSYKMVGSIGCDVGVVSATTNFYDIGLPWMNNNLGLATNRNGTQRTTFAPGEGTVWTAPGFGERTNSLGYFLEGTRSFTVLGDGSFHLWEYAWLLSSFMETKGMQLEMDQISGTNFVRVFGSANTFNLSDAYVVGQPASWCMIRSSAQNILSSLDGVQLTFPNFIGAVELHLLDYPKNSLATLLNNGDRGIVTVNGDTNYFFRCDAMTMFHQPGQFQLRNPYYGAGDPFATNMQYQWGRLGLQHSFYDEPDYWSSVIKVNQNQRFTRLINSDPQTAQEVSNQGNIIGTNITVGNLRAGGLVSSGTGFAGDGSALTNIGAFRTYIVTAFGAIPYLHNDNSTPVNPASLTDSSDLIQSAINTAAGSGGNRNILYFPPGIYKITTNLWVPKNVFILGAGVMMANGASPYATTTNNYSMIWRIGQGDAVSFYQVGPGNGNGIKDISIHGYTNPVDSVTLVTAPSSTMGNIGLRAFNEDTFFCQRFDLDNVSIVGFKVGFWPEVNGSVFNRLATMGCDVGLVSTYTNHFADLTTAGLSYFNTNILILVTNRDGTRRNSMARGEGSVLMAPGLGERTNSLGYFIAGTRSFTVIGEGSFHLSEYAWLHDSWMSVDGMQLEMDALSSTNFIRTFGTDVSFRLNDAYITGSPASWVMIRNRSTGFIGSLDGMHFGGFPNAPGLDELRLLDTLHTYRTTLQNNGPRGIVTLDDNLAWYQRVDAQTMFHEMGQYQLRNPYYGGADPFATNLSLQMGRVGIQHSHYASDNDYLSGALWFGDGFNQQQRFTRFLNSDPDTAQQVADRGNIINTNFTVGTLRATGNLIANQFIGDGGGLTNIGGALPAALTNNDTRDVHFANSLSVTGNISGALAVGGTFYNHVLAAFGHLGNPLRNEHQVAVYSALSYASNFYNANGGDSFIAGFESAIGTQPGNYTVSNAFNFTPATISKGAGSTITRTVNYGITDQVAGTHNAHFAEWPGNFTGDWFMYYTGSRPSLFGGDMTISGNNLMIGKEVFRSVANDYLRIAGGTGASQGGNIIFFGQSHSTLANKLSLTGSGGITLNSPSIVDSTLNVIGTTTMGVASTTQGVLYMRASGSAGAYAVFYSPNTAYYHLEAKDDYLSLFASAAASGLVLQQTTGNVGIGTTTPVGKLDVNGTARVAELFVTNGITLGGVRRTDWPDGSGSGIQTNAGSGINNTLTNLTLYGRLTNDSVIASGTIIRTNYTTGIRSVESAAGHLFYPTNSTDPTININGVTGEVTATNFIGAGGDLTLDASGFNGNLNTSDNTLQEVAQRVDDLAIVGGSATNAVNVLKENGAQVGDADITALDFLGADFDLTESPNQEVNVVIAAAIARDAEVAAAYQPIGALTNNNASDVTLAGSLRVNGQGLTIYGASGDPTLAFEGGTPAGTNQIHSDSGGLKFYFGDIADADFTITEDNVTAANYIGAGGGLTLDASGFNGNLTTSDNTVQEVAQKLDDLAAGVPTSRTLTVAGTANEITSSAGAQDLSANRTWTLSLPATIDLSGKTSLAIPGAAAPTVDAFGEIAGDNNLWASGRGAPIFYDGTAAVGLVGALVSDTPSNGQVPTWNTGGTITWETPATASSPFPMTQNTVIATNAGFDGLYMMIETNFVNNGGEGMALRFNRIGDTAARLYQGYPAGELHVSGIPFVVDSGLNIAALGGSGTKLLQVNDDGDVSIANGNPAVPSNLTVEGSLTVDGTISAGTNTANYSTAGITYALDTVYTNLSVARGLLVGAFDLTSATTGTSEIILRYTNNAVGYQVQGRNGALTVSRNVSSFCVPLNPGATFQFVSTFGTGASGSIAETVLWKQ